MKRVEVIIDADGGIKIDAHGFSGPDCDKATRFLESALGVATKKHKKPEHAQQATQGRKAVQ